MSKMRCTRCGGGEIPRCEGFHEVTDEMIDAAIADLRRVKNKGRGRVARLHVNIDGTSTRLGALCRVFEFLNRNENLASWSES